MAVYTEVADDALITFAAQYDIGEVISCKGIAEGVENSNYMLRTARAAYILTLYEKRVSRADLPFFLGLMDHLASRGIACPTPVHGRDGAALRELCGRPAAIVTFLEGMWPRRIQPHHCARLGEALARLHQAGAGYPARRPNGLSVDAWHRLHAETQERAHEVRPGLADEIAAELGVIGRSWPNGLPAGVIHADLFPDNVFFRGEALSGLIDFYFACNDLLAYDIAICLNAWCFESDGSFNVTKARLMLSAYGKVRPIGAEEFAALPILARGACVRFLLTRLFDWLNHPPGAMVKPKDPLEYLAKLRFHQTARGPGAYGLG
ncbi:MAG: homoserine kinase [Rhodospirillaceae bacterium]|nr:homoserine kinase [Rhodospirillaceae bacterium]